VILARVAVPFGLEHGDATVDLVDGGQVVIERLLLTGQLERPMARRRSRRALSRTRTKPRIASSSRDDTKIAT